MWWHLTAIVCACADNSIHHLDNKIYINESHIYNMCCVCCTSSTIKLIFIVWLTITYHLYCPDAMCAYLLSKQVTCILRRRFGMKKIFTFNVQYTSILCNINNLGLLNIHKWRNSYRSDIFGWLELIESTISCIVHHPRIFPSVQICIYNLTITSHLHSFSCYSN